MTTSATASCRLTGINGWERWMIGNPVYNPLLGTLFEWGVAAHGLETTRFRRGEKSMAEVRRDLGGDRQEGGQAGRQGLPGLPGAVGSELEAHPAGQRDRQPDPQLLGLHGAVLQAGISPMAQRVPPQEEFADETHARSGICADAGPRQFRAGPVMAFMSGNLCCQIEHHLGSGPAHATATPRDQPKVRARCPTNTTCRTHDGFPSAPVLSVILDQFSSWPPAGQVAEGHLRRRPGDPFRAQVPGCGPACASFGVDAQTGRRRGSRTGRRARLETGSIRASVSQEPAQRRQRRCWRRRLDTTGDPLREASLTQLLTSDS